MNHKTMGIKTILLAEDDPEDVELMLAALEETWGKIISKIPLSALGAFWAGVNESPPYEGDKKKKICFREGRSVPPERERSTMRSPLRILHLEDDPNDASLVESALEAEGIACATICVQDRDDFVAALESGGIDLILSDFSLPCWMGFRRLPPCVPAGRICP